MRCNERLVVRVLIFERGGEGSGDVFAGDLTPPPELLGHIYGASTLIFGQAARTDDGVVQTTVPQSFVGAGLGAEIRTHRLGAPLGVARAHGAEHQVAAHPASLRGLDELDGPTVVHRLLARIPAPRSGGEHDGVAPLDRPSDPPFDFLGFEIDHHRLGAVRLDVACLLLLADQPPDLVAIRDQHPYQAPRRLAVRASDQNPQETTSFESALQLVSTSARSGWRPRLSAFQHVSFRLRKPLLTRESRRLERAEVLTSRRAKQGDVLTS